MKLMSITWLDANSPSSNSWATPDDVECILVKVHTVGYVVSETDEAITVAGSVCESEYNIHGLMTIPKISITKKKMLK